MTAGIDITNASLTTINNTFQNLTYQGITDTINTLMNARLSLTPQSFANPNTGNRFWNCGRGITCLNVFDFDIEQASFRSCYWGIENPSNRFRYRIRHNSFSNVNIGVKTDFTGGNYNLNGQVQNGIYADSLIISQNFFGAELSPTDPYHPSHFLGNGIVLGGDNNPVWNIQTSTNYIQSNIVDRVTGGIIVDGMSNYPLELSNNFVELDYINNIGAWWASIGILLHGTLGAKIVSHNHISSNGIGANSQVPNSNSFVFWDNLNPIIHCNYEEYNATGFSFSGNNPCSWLGNQMFDNITGLYHGYNAMLGQQGNNSMASGNQWLGSWGNGTNETYVVNSFPSPLYVNPGSPFEPINNASWSGSPYTLSVSLFTTTAPPFTCPTPTFPVLPTMTPGQKTAAQFMTKITEEEKAQGWNIQVFPNPTSGNVTLVSENETELLSVNLFDVTGKSVYSDKILTSSYQSTINFNVLEGVYLIEIKGQNGRKLHKKLIISK